MDHTFFSAFFLLLLVLDPLGAIPVFLSVMRRVPPARRPWVTVREITLASAVLLAFMFSGKAFLSLMHLSERSLEVAGGVILLMIAIKMIFTGGASSFGESGTMGEPLLFPLAVPLFAGPSAMALVLLMSSRQPEQMLTWVAALLAAMLVCGMLLLVADRLRRCLGDSVVFALEKLMGLVLTAISVEMILAGLKQYFFGAPL